jgi:hypothetical protein
MPESKKIAFTHKELATLMIKNQNICEGWWGIYVKFGIKAVNIGQSPSDLLPAAIVPVLEIGLQKFDEESNLSVDAAKVNPSAAKRGPRKAKK